MIPRRIPYFLFWGIVLALIGLAVQVTTTQAAPAAPTEFTVTQPDGATFTARMWGDEWLHGYETPDGFTILQIEDGAWVYAARGAGGALAPVLQDGLPMRVGQAAPPNEALNARPVPPANSPAPQVLRSGPARSPNTGTQRLLMVMVNFANRTRTYTPAYFQGKGFGASNSIRDYYLKASYNALDLQPAAESQETANDGMIEVTLAMNHPNDTDESQTIAAAVLNAINPSINFAAFDTDGDEYVTSTELHLLFIIAGYEESYGVTCDEDTPCIWAHQWGLVSPLLLDGKYVGADSADGDFGGYAMFGEIHGDHPATIGIMAHELGHNLSWPDLYDTDYSSMGVGAWSIMGGGSWNGLSQYGDSPALPDAWLKWYQGWITPTPAVDGQTYTLDRANSVAEALLMGVNNNGVDWDFNKYSGTGEFFLAENRQLNGYDAGLPGCGILIWHIDETRSSQNNANATETRPLVYLEQADGYFDLQNKVNDGDTGDPYPGSSNNTRFNHTSTPNSRYYSGFGSGHDLTINSAACGTTMNVTYTASASTTSSVYLPLITKPPVPYTGKVTLKGAAAAGLTIEMWYTTDNWQTTSILFDTTTTDASGNYTFPSTPSVGNGKEIGVRWLNPNSGSTGTYDQRLAGWICYAVEAQATSYSCSFDVQDVVLTAPASSASVNLPYTFKWNRRTTTSDRYEVDWWDESLSQYMWTDPLLGYVGSFTLNMIPSYWYIGYPYKWTVYPVGSNGYGVAYFYRWVIFNDRSSPPLEGVGLSSDLLFGQGAPYSLFTRFRVYGNAPQPRPAVEGVEPR